MPWIAQLENIPLNSEKPPANPEPKPALAGNMAAQAPFNSASLTGSNQPMPDLTPKIPADPSVENLAGLGPSYLSPQEPQKLPFAKQLEEEIRAYQKRNPPGTATNEFSSGFSRNLLGAIENVGGTVRQLGESWGSDKLGRIGEAIQGTAAYERADLPLPRIAETGKITNLEDFGDWFWSKLGEGVGSTTGMLAAGATTGTPGVLLTGLGMGMGEVRNELERAGITDKERLADYTYIAGSVVGALDTLVPAKMLGSLSDGTKRALGRYVTTRLAKSAAKGSLKEGVTEAIQEATIIAATGAAKGEQEAIKIMTNGLTAIGENPKRIWEAAAAGAVPGAAFGTVTGVGQEIGAERDYRAQPGLKGQILPPARVETKSADPDWATTIENAAPSQSPRRDFAVEDAPLGGFYSPAQKALSEAKHKKAPASQWVNQFSKGAQGREAKELGLDLWLKEKPAGQSVTANEINDWLKAHEVEVEQRTFTGDDLQQPQGRIRPHSSNYREVVLKPKGLEYDSPHFGENEVVAITLGDRQGPRGENYSALEHVQSDLHQKARKQGYRSAKIKDLDALLDKATYMAADDPGREALRQQIAETRNELRSSSGKLPDAPFKDELWWQLGVKWAISDALNNNKDGMIIPNARQMAQAANTSEEKLKPFYDKLEGWAKKYTRSLGGEVVEETIPDYVSDQVPFDSRPPLKLAAGKNREDIAKAFQAYGEAYKNSPVYVDKARAAMSIGGFLENIADSPHYMSNLESFYYEGYAGLNFRNELTEGFYTDTKGNKFDPVLKKPTHTVLKFPQQMREEITRSGQSLFAASEAAPRAAEPTEQAAQPSFLEPLRGRFAKRVELADNLPPARAQAQMKTLLSAGRSVTTSPQLKALFDKSVTQVGNLIPEGVDAAILTRIDPVGRGRIRAIYTGQGGQQYSFYGTPEELFSARAFTDTGPDGSSLFFTRLNSAQLSDQRFMGELWHESTHALRRQGLFDDVRWGRLLSHANSLGVLDLNYREFAKKINSPNWQDYADGVTIRDLYEDVYGEAYSGNRTEIDEAINQEAVAHMLEMITHNAFPESAVAPIADIMAAMRSGQIRSEAATSSAARDYAAEGPQSNKTALYNKLKEMGFKQSDNFDDLFSILVGGKEYTFGSTPTGPWVLVDESYNGTNHILGPAPLNEAFIDEIFNWMAMQPPVAAESYYNKSAMKAAVNEALDSLKKQLDDQLVSAEPATTQVDEEKPTYQLDDIKTDFIIENPNGFWDKFNTFESLKNMSLETSSAIVDYVIKNQYKPEVLFSVKIGDNIVGYGLQTSSPDGNTINSQIFGNKGEIFKNYKDILDDFNKQAPKKNIEENFPSLEEAETEQKPTQPYSWDEAYDAANTYLSKAYNNANNDFLDQLNEGDFWWNKYAPEEKAKGDIKNGLIKIVTAYRDHHSTGFNFKEALTTAIEILKGAQPGVVQVQEEQLDLEPAKLSLEEAEAQLTPLGQKLFKTLQEPKWLKKYAHKEYFSGDMIKAVSRAITRYLKDNENAVAPSIKEKLLQIAEDIVPQPKKAEQTTSDDYVSTEPDPQIVENLAIADEEEIADLQDYIDNDTHPTTNGHFSVILEEYGGSLPFNIKELKKVRSLLQDHIADLKQEDIVSKQLNFTLEKLNTIIANPQSSETTDSVDSILGQVASIVGEQPNEPITSFEELIRNEGLFSETSPKVENSIKDLSGNMFGGWPKNDQEKLQLIRAIDEELTVNESGYVTKQYNSVTDKLKSALFGAAPEQPFVQPRDSEQPIYPTVEAAAKTLSSTGKAYLDDITGNLMDKLIAKASKDPDIQLDTQVTGTNWNKNVSDAIKKHLLNLAKNKIDIPKAVRDDLERIAQGLVNKPVDSLEAITQLNRSVELGDPSKVQFRFSGKGSGGSKPKEIWTDPDGNQYMFKPVKKGEEFVAYAEAIGGKISRLLNPQAPDIFTNSLNGRFGVMQRFLPAESTGITNDVTQLSVEDIKTLQREHVVDWLISNHDGHKNQFIRLEDGELVGIDKGQAFKYMGKDRLSTDYHPNAKYGEDEPIYNYLWRAYERGDLTQFSKFIKQDEFQDIKNSTKGAMEIDKKIKEIEQQIIKDNLLHQQFLADLTLEVRNVLNSQPVKEAAENLLEKTKPYASSVDDVVANMDKYTRETGKLITHYAGTILENILSTQKTKEGKKLVQNYVDKIKGKEPYDIDDNVPYKLYGPLSNLQIKAATFLSDIKAHLVNKQKNNETYDAFFVKRLESLNATVRSLAQELAQIAHEGSTSSGYPTMNSINDLHREINSLKTQKTELLKKQQDAMKEYKNALFREIIEAIDHVQTELTDIKYEAFLRPYAESRWSDPIKVNAFINYALRRKNTLGARFQQFFLGLEEAQTRYRRAFLENSFAGATELENYDLEDFEKKAIQRYTGASSGMINSPMRKKKPIEFGKVNDEWLRAAELADVIHRALEKLPSIQGTVYRGEGLTPNVNEFIQGRIWRNTGLLSTSTSKEFAQGWKSDVQYVIETHPKNSKGKSVKHLSNHPTENEVLFPDGTEFLVTHVIREPTAAGSTYTVYLEELPEIDFDSIK